MVLKWWLWRWGVPCALALFAPAQVAVAQTEISVRNLLGEQAITDPLPVRVELRQRGEATRGILEWWTGTGPRHRMAIELPAGARKVVYLRLSLDAWRLPERRRRALMSVPTLLWRSETGEWRLLDVPIGWGNRLPLVIIGDVQGGFEQWKQASFSLQSRFGTQVVSSPDWSLQPVYWSPEMVPTEWTALLGIPMMVLMEGSERLSREQWDALLAWMLAGGHLVVSVGSVGEPLKGTPLAPLLNKPPLPQHASEARGEVHDSPLPQRGRGAGGEGNLPLASSRRVGRGTLSLFAGDLSARRWREWQGLNALINQWTARLTLPLDGIRTGFESESLRPSVARAQILGVLGVFALYWLALYLAWRILRRRRRLIRAPLVVLLLTAGCWLALVQLVPASVHRAQRREVCTLLADSRLPVAIEHRLYHFLLPAGVHRLRWAGAIQPLVSRQQALLGERIIVEHGADTLMRIQPMGALEMQVQMVRLLHLPAPVRVERQGEQYTLHNPLPYPLQQVHIRRGLLSGAPTGTFELADLLASGARLTATPRKVLRLYDGLTPREGEWLTATIPAMPSPLRTPIDGQEEPARLWVCIR